jgi:hypothetical protein
VWLDISNRNRRAKVDRAFDYFLGFAQESFAGQPTDADESARLGIRVAAFDAGNARLRPGRLFTCRRLS